MWQSIGLTLLVIVATLACVLLFMLCGEFRRLPSAMVCGRAGLTLVCSACVPHLHPPPSQISDGSSLLRLTGGSEKGTVPRSMRERMWFAAPPSLCSQIILSLEMPPEFNSVTNLKLIAFCFM